ncbi:MAG: DNA polymerase I [Clostridia bacterium]|nr:DNA polymerase I [Clostridia bacterium]MBR6966483.1 DNA polymerase I [Clostridia bacterium]
MKDIFLLVDGNSLMHRAFHALPVMDADGVYTNAVYGFLSMLLKVIREENVQYLAVCFDEHGPTFRHTVYADYKAGRRETPPELRQQFGTILSLLDDMGIRRFSLQGWEADDLLGTLSLKGAEAGVTPLLLTGDRDALQLVGGGTELMFTRKGISETIRFTPSKVYEEYGFTPEQVTDWKGLAGDSSDNIPGVPGVGDKTAVKLLQEYGTLEEVLANAGNVKGKLGEKLAAFADQARFSKDLATIRRDAPVEFSLSACAMPDLKKGIPALQKLKLNSIIRRLDEAGTGGEEEKKPELKQIDFEPAAVLDSREGIVSWLRETSKHGNLCIYLSDLSVSLARKGGKRAEIGLGGDLLNPGLDPKEVLECLLEELQHGDGIVHNGKALLHLLDRCGLPVPETFSWDTMLAAYLLNPQEKSYRLGALCPDKPEDAGTLCALAAWQQAQVEENGMMKLMREVEMPLSFVLFRMERAGFTVDTAFLRDLGARYTAEIGEKRDQVTAAAGHPFNLNSTQQLGEILFEEMNLPHGKKTSKGYSTSVEVLEGLRFDAPEIIEPLLRYRQLTKLNSTYVEGLLRLVDGKGRVHSTFDQTATATGRISSSEPNLQNIPVRTEEGKEIREAFLPRKGWVLLDADYSQIELRLMAHFSGDPALIDAFRKGEDIHARTASEIFDVPLEWVTPELRSRAKAVNFGLIYGISGFGLSRNTGVSRKEAAAFIEKYFQTYPGVKRFMDRTAAEGADRGYAETLMGRRRYLPELKSPKAPIREFGKRAAMNTPVQGTAADIIKLAMVRIDRALREAGLQSRLILQVHDELLLECPPEEADRAAELLRAAMEGAIELSVPLVAEVHRGENWAEAK